MYHMTAFPMSVFMRVSSTVSISMESSIFFVLYVFIWYVFYYGFGCFYAYPLLHSVSVGFKVNDAVGADRPHVFRVESENFQRIVGSFS